MAARSDFVSVILGVSLLTGASVIAGDLTWNVAGDGDWDKTSPNWTGEASTFSDGDNVTFDNVAGGVITVKDMSPTSTTADNASGEYVFVSGDPLVGDENLGSPSILTGSLVKNGAGTLQLGPMDLAPPWKNPLYMNGFTSVAVNGGTIQYSGHDAFGTSTVTLAGGTALIGVGSAEGRYKFNNEDFANAIVLSGGNVSLPVSHGTAKDIWFAGVVSGPGGFHITGTHRTISLSSDNTFEGGVVLESTDSSPNALLIGSYTALGTGTLRVSQTYNGSDGRGGLLAGEDLSGDGGNPDGVTNPIVISAESYFNVSGDSEGNDLLLSGEISGFGTLRKHKNASTVTLSGVNTYTGGTEVVAGVLACTSADSLGGGALSIGTGATVQLDFIGTRLVSSLTVDGGAPSLDGTYGSSSSPAMNKDDEHFAGTGTVTVGSPQKPSFLRGDADANGVINITDGIFTLNYLFLGGPGPSCHNAADTDSSDDVNITDGIYVLNFLFLGGPPPEPPWPDCGSNPFADGNVTCETSHPGCGV